MLNVSSEHSFKNFIMFLISSGVVGDIKKFQGLDDLNNQCSAFWEE